MLRARPIAVAVWPLLLGLILVACTSAEPDRETAEERHQRAVEQWDPAAYTAAMVYCMNEAGFAAELTTSTSAAYDLGEQTVQGREALAACEASMVESGLKPPSIPKSDDRLSAQYDEAHTAAACLEARGVDVPPAPSRESFIEHAGSNWNLFANVPQSQWRRIVELQEECLG